MRLRTVFLRDLCLPARIGVHPHEMGRAQRVRLNVEVTVPDEAAALPGGVGADELSRVLDYAWLAAAVRDVVAAGHVRLVETLAERVAATCFGDARVRTVRVQVEKLDVFDDMAAAGVSITRDAPPDRDLSTPPVDTQP